MRDGKILTAHESWLLNTRNRVARGERPLIPGQRHEGDPVQVGYQFDRSDYDRWSEHVRQAVNGCLPVLTLQEWLNERKSTQPTPAQQAAAARRRVDEMRAQQYPRDPR